MEKRFARDPMLFQQYKQFMDELTHMGHMKLMQWFDIPKEHDKRYIMPHHSVIKEASITTRLRVLFDLSA